MDNDLVNLHSRRVQLVDGFQRLASHTGVPLDHSSDTKTLDLCSRLYDAVSGGRRINIDYNPQSQLVRDSFIKDFDSELGFTRLLTVFVNDAPLDIPWLWDVTKGWLYDMVQEDSALFV